VNSRALIYLQSNPSAHTSSGNGLYLLSAAGSSSAVELQVPGVHEDSGEPASPVPEPIYEDVFERSNIFGNHEELDHSQSSAQPYPAPSWETLVAIYGEDMARLAYHNSFQPENEREWQL
jgi:hypothetical protein